MAQRHSDNKPGKAAATTSSGSGNATTTSPAAPARRRLKKLSELEYGDANGETAGKSQVGDTTGSASSGSGGGASGNGVKGREQKAEKDGKSERELDGDVLMDEQDQIAFDEKLAKDIHEAEVKENEARAKRQQVSDALARRMAARRRARSPPEGSRFVPEVSISKIDASVLWEFVTDKAKIVYGIKPMSIKPGFEVIWIARAKADVMVIDDGEDAEGKVAVATQALFAADLVIGSIKSSKLDSQTSPVVAAAVSSPAAAAAAPSPAVPPLREQASPQAPNAPMIPRPRTIPEFMEPRPRSPRPKKHAQRPPSMVGLKKTRVAVPVEDIEVSEDEVCPPTQVVEWSLSPHQVLESPQSPASRLFAKQVDRYAREEAARAGRDT